MSRVEWDVLRTHEEGVDHAVIYSSGTASAWSGVTLVDEVPIGGDVVSVYFDGIKTIDMVSSEDFSMGISAYTYPDVVETLEKGVGTFDFTYRTTQKPGRKIHLVYNGTLFHDSKPRKTTTDTPDPEMFSWVAYTRPTEVPGAYPTAHMVVDTLVADPRSVTQLELILYGDEATDPRMPPADEVVDIFGAYATLIIVNHGDGTWTATGPDDVVKMLDSTTFEIDWPSVIYISEDTYTVSSL